jgi:NADPH:quinone reductase-like Zn-dependent oxidoreductase
MASAGRTPEWTRALVLKKCAAEAKPVYHDAVLEKRPLRQLQHGEILVKISAASFNRRDVSITLLVALVVAGFVAHPDALIALDTSWSIPGT